MKEKVQKVIDRIRNGIERTLKNEIPEIKAVVQAN
jgi:Fe-S cluster biogenesis protein NfuA